MAGNGDADKAKRPVAEAGRPRPDLQNEWTASDRRGPLSAAEEEAAAEAERIREAEAPPDNPHVHSQEPALHQPISADGSHPAASVEHEPTPEPPSAELAASDSPTEPAPGEAPRRHVPVLPIIAALVVGAIIGAASAAVVYRTSDQGDVGALTARLDALEKRPDPQPELDGLKASLAKLSSQKSGPAAPAFDPGPLQQKITALAADVDALKSRGADNSLTDKVAALDGAVIALKTQGAEVKGLDEKVAGIAASIESLKQEGQSAQAGISSLQSGQKSLEGKTGAPALAVAADSLVAAIAQGRAYASQVDALAALGADPAKIAVLRENADKGVPSAQALQAKFEPLVDPIIATANQAPPNAGFGERLKSGLFGLVTVRRRDATGGDDVASRASRIEGDLAHGDVAGAYETWNGLPAEAKAKAEAWGALAKTQVTTMAAAQALQSQAIAALGKKS